MRPVEQMVDAAIERIAREHGLALKGDSDLSFASVKPMNGGAPTRLRWKGLDVSDEFRSYAERVARGEDLPPFEGRVLAEPNPSFPWGPSARVEPQRTSRGMSVALGASAVLVLGLLGWSVAVKLEAPRAVIIPPAVEEPVPVQVAMSLRDVVEAPDSPPTAPTALEVGAAEGIEPTAALPEPTISVIPNGADTLVSTVTPQVAPVLDAAPLPAVDAALPSALVAPPPAPAPRAAAVPAPTPPKPPVAAPLATAPAPVINKAPPPVKPEPDEFGIMTADPAPVAPAPVPSGVKPASAGVSSVGDVARSSQPAAAGVRKAPGSESSAKGSLLVETPSF